MKENENKYNYNRAYFNIKTFIWAFYERWREFIKLQKKKNILS